MQTAADAPVLAVRAVAPGNSRKTAVDPVELEQRLLRFADQLIAATTSSVDKLRRGTNAISPAEALSLKILFATEVSSIASGANIYANLLDMTVFVTVARLSVENHWQPDVYGDSAQQLLDLCRHFETQIWSHASVLLNPEQQAELHEAILAWRQAHPTPETVMGVRALGLASEVARAKRAASKDTGVFYWLRLDPLADLSPATREVAQTRLFAERALYVAQVMPTLLRWQTELLTLNAMAAPEVRELITNTTHLAASVDRFSLVAEQLPEHFSAEREEFLSALQSHEQGLAALAAEVRQALTAGTQMSTSLNTTLTTFDAIIRRFGVGEPAQGLPDTNALPFNIQDYARAAGQFTLLARELNALLTDTTNLLDSPALQQRAQDLEMVARRVKDDARSVLNHAFLLGVALVMFSLAAALVYRWLGIRIRSAPP
jgi:hypothetical protein